MIYLDFVNELISPLGGISNYFHKFEEFLVANDIDHVSGHFIDNKNNCENSILQKKRKLERYRRSFCTENAQVFISSYYRRPKLANVKNIVIVHDFIYEECVKGLKKNVHIYQKFKALCNADKIICISNSCRKDLDRYYGPPSVPTRVIYNGVSDDFYQVKSLFKYENYALYVGKRHRYKNFSLLVDSLSSIKSNLDICAVGGEKWSSAEISDVESKINGKLCIIEFAPNQQLNDLYNHAAFLACTSLKEGFGLTVVEAMASGCPVVATYSEAIKEVGDTCIFQSDGNSVNEYAELILRALGGEREKKINLGLERSSLFSWNKTFSEIIDFISH